MARIRSIHPEQWTDEDFCSLSPMARLLAIGIRNEADDNGIFPFKPFDLKLSILPVDQCDINALLAELTDANQFMVYEVEGRKYGLIRNFQLYQSSKMPSYKHPLPDGELPRGYALRGTPKKHQWNLASENPTPALPQCYPSPAPALPQPCPTDKDKEMDKDKDKEMDKDKEEEKDKIKTPLAPRGGDPADSTATPKQTTAQRKDEAKAATRAAILEAWNALAAEHGLPMVETLNAKRHKHMNARLDDAWFKTHWQEAMATIPQSRFHLGVNERNWKATIDWFISEGKLQSFYELHRAKLDAPQPRSDAKPEPMSTSEYYAREIAKQKAADAAFKQQCIDDYLRDNPGAEIPEEAA